MATACVDKNARKRLKEGVANGTLNIADLYKMTPEQRRGAFQAYVDPEMATYISTNFERAMVSKQKDSLKKWAEKTFKDDKKKTSTYQNTIKKINSLDQLGVLNPATAEMFMADLVSDEMGLSLSSQELTKIREGAEKLETLSSQVDAEGIPVEDYWVQREKFESYLQSLAPRSSLRVLTSTAGRGAMLFSVKSPLTNIVGNTVQGLTQAMERRISSGQYAGTNGAFSRAYIEKVKNIYQKSGFDISRMDTLESEQIRLGEKITHSEGPGAARAVGRFYEDIVFKQLLGFPDVISSAINFADSADLASTKVARHEGLKGDEAKARALQIFKDATRVDPQTEEGKLVRAQAVADAHYATFTNDGGYSAIAMGIRDILNNATADIRLGDQLMPFVKTPANVVQASIEASPAGLIGIAIKLPEAWRQLKLGNPKPMRQVARLGVRLGLGTTLATILVFMIDPEDFVGEYESVTGKGKSLTRIKGAGYNTLKIGNKYVSLDYFGPLAAHMVGMMYARKYGNTLPEKLTQYGKGVGSQVLRVPGLRTMGDIVEGTKRALTQSDIGGTLASTGDDMVAYLRSRIIPAIVSDFAKGLDPFEREAGNAWEKVLTSVPFARQTLPVRTSQITGKPEKGQDLVSAVLFGSRVRTANEEALVKEIVRLEDSGELPALSNIATSSGRMRKLQEQVSPAAFRQSIIHYGRTFGENATDLITRDDYKLSTDEEKKDMLNSVRRDALEDTLIVFGYNEDADILEEDK